MEPILDLAFQLYRAAQDMPLEDFEALALSVLKALIPFCAAVWLAARYERGRLTLLRSHLQGLPREALPLLVRPDGPFCQAAAIAAGAPRRAHGLHVPSLCRDGQADAASELARRHHLERQLLIADAAASSSPGNWLALYRSDTDPPFDERDYRVLALSMPHMSQALAINRRLHLGSGPAESPRNVSVQAVVRADGKLIHCGERLRQALRTRYPAWEGTALPDELIGKLRRNDAIELSSDARLCVSRMGAAVLLVLQEVPPTGRLSARELEVAQLFGAGASYKQIARQVSISPATVRNVVQNTYRKLKINNKAQLACLVADSRWREPTPA